MTRVLVPLLRVTPTLPSPIKGEGLNGRRPHSSPSPSMGEGRGGGETPT